MELADKKTRVMILTRQRRFSELFKVQIDNEMVEPQKLPDTWAWQSMRSSRTRHRFKNRQTGQRKW